MQRADWSAVCVIECFEEHSLPLIVQTTGKGRTKGHVFGQQSNISWFRNMKVNLRTNCLFNSFSHSLKPYLIQ